jgi:hypothetical protein
MIYHSVGCTLKDKPKSELFYSQEVPQLGGRSALIGNLTIGRSRGAVHALQKKTFVDELRKGIGPWCAHLVFRLGSR